MDDVEKYISWVIHKTEQIKQYTSSLDKPDISLEDLKEIIRKRVHISLMLITEYKRYQRQLKDIERDYSIWWSKKYCEVRKEINPVSLASGKWLSLSEINAEVINKYEDEYRNYHKRKDDLDDQVSVMKRILDLWGTLQKDLGLLVQVFTLEANDLSMSNRIENTYKQGTQRRQKKSGE